MTVREDAITTTRLDVERVRLSSGIPLCGPIEARTGTWDTLTKLQTVHMEFSAVGPR